MTYLFIGPDILKKDAKISELKSKLFKNSSALSFDFETLYASKLDADDLRKALLTLPYLSDQRMVVIRQCERLKERNREIVLAFLAEQIKSTVLILDFNELDLKSALYRHLNSLSQAMTFGVEKDVNVFDVTRAISSRNAAGALKLLYELLEKDVHPLQIMGGLVWFWTKERERLSAHKYIQGLRVLEEADLNIKRSRLKPEHAVEKVVVHLVALQGN